VSAEWRGHEPIQPTPLKITIGGAMKALGLTGKVPKRTDDFYLCYSALFFMPISKSRTISRFDLHQAYSDDEVCSLHEPRFSEYVQEKR
jgi:hypothetical protein